MKSFPSRILVISLAAWAAAASGAFAWGDDGHQIVCRIAYLLLQPAEQEEVDRLTDLYRRPGGGRYQTWPEACTFPDLARSKAREYRPGAAWKYFRRFDRWHFLNVPRDTHEVSVDHCADNCVLRGIDYHSRRIARSDLDEWKRAESLFFLGHWIGDIHQPLHVSFEDDLGGNEIKPIGGGFYQPYALHYVWDTGIIRKALGNSGWQGFATALAAAITPAQREQWRAATPLEWAQESYAITTTAGAEYCEWETNPEGDWCSPEGPTRQLGASYQGEFQDDVELRLQQAGARLADQIGTALDL